MSGTDILRVSWCSINVFEIGNSRYHHLHSVLWTQNGDAHQHHIRFETTWAQCVWDITYPTNTWLIKRKSLHDLGVKSNLTRVINIIHRFKLVIWVEFWYNSKLILFTQWKSYRYLWQVVTFCQWCSVFLEICLQWSVMWTIKYC